MNLIAEITLYIFYNVHSHTSFSHSFNHSCFEAD